MVKNVFHVFLERQGESMMERLTGGNFLYGCILICLIVVIILCCLIFAGVRRQGRLSVMPELRLFMPKFVLYYAPDPDAAYQQSNYLCFDILNTGNGTAGDITIKYSINRSFLEGCRWCRVHNSRVAIRVNRSETRTYSLVEKCRLNAPVPRDGKLEIMPKKLNRLLYAVWALYLKNGEEIPDIVRIMDIEMIYKDILKKTYQSNYQILFINEEVMPAWTDVLEGAFFSYKAIEGKKRT